MRDINPTVPGARLGMPVTAWPEPDQIAWAAAFAPQGLLDDAPHGSNLRLPTRSALETCYARWLLYIRQSEPAALDLPIEDRATRQRVVAYVRVLQKQLSALTVYGYIARLKRALELLTSDTEWSWMMPMLRKLNKLARKAGHTRPRPIVSPKALFAYGIKLMKQAETATQAADGNGNGNFYCNGASNGDADGNGDSELNAERGDGLELRAELYRDGLAIAFLAARPLRLKNLLGLEIGKNFLTIASGYAVDLSEEETKTHAPLAFPVPVKLVPFIRCYLDRYRPVLAAGPYGPVAGYPEPADALWLARSGRRFPVASIEAMIAKRTTEQFGVRLTPHRFRHCAATAIIENNPEEFHIIRIILGHTTSATGETYYIEKRNRDAFRMAQDNIIARSEPKTRTHQARTEHRLNDGMHDPAAAGMIRLAGHTRAYTRRFIR